LQLTDSKENIQINIPFAEVPQDFVESKDNNRKKDGKYNSRLRSKNSKKRIVKKYK